MRILMLLEHVFPQDERVEKEIHTLLEDGHDVRIATYSFESVSFEDNTLGYTVYRKHIGKTMYKMSAAILVLPFYFSFWRKYVKTIYRQWAFDAIHIHDLPLSRIGYEYKVRYKVRFVADQHELYSNWIVKTAHYNTLIGSIVRLLGNWVSYEQKYLSRADLVCTVEEPLRAFYLQERGLDPEKVIVVPNTPLKSIYRVKPKVEERSHFKLFYCGGLDNLRGLDMVVQSLPLIRKQIAEIRLVLVGRKWKHFDLEKYAAEMGVEDLIDFRGLVDYRKLPQEIDRSDICFFVPPANREEIHNTIATKIYQYMARGKPVIVGSARYMKAFVEKHEIGLSIDEKEPAQFARAVIRIYDNPALKEKFSKNAASLIESYYWEHTIGPLVDKYRQ